VKEQLIGLLINRGGQQPGKPPMIMLKDVPGGMSVAESLAQAVEALSLLYACSPDDKAQSHLEGFIGRIENGLGEAVGPDTAPILLNALRSAVMTRKHQIEAVGASRA
jgi:hypothetical protein